jgi:hypothetical protein
MYIYIIYNIYTFVNILLSIENIKTYFVYLNTYIYMGIYKYMYIYYSTIFILLSIENIKT